MDVFESLQIQVSLVEITKQLAMIELILLHKGIVSESELQQYKAAADKLIDEKHGTSEQEALNKMNSLLGKLGLGH